MARAKWYSTASAQCGAICVGQLLAAGLSLSAIDRLVASGALVRVLPSVFIVGGSAAAPAQKLWAAHLYFGEDSAISHTTGAWRWGFDAFAPLPIHVSTMTWKSCRTLFLPDGSPVVVHRVDDRLAPEIDRVDGLPVTSVRRTIVDLCGGKHPRAGRVIDAALRKEMTTMGNLWRFLQQEWIRGRRGVAIMRDLLAARTPGRVPSDSELERMLRDLIDKDGLPAPRHQWPVELPDARIHIDLAYPEAMLALEVDSTSFHLDRVAFERDRKRDIELQALGWTVYRFTFAMIRFEPELVLRRIRDHLERAAPHPRGAECAYDSG